MKIFRNSTLRRKIEKVIFWQEKTFPGKIIWTLGKRWNAKIGLARKNCSCGKKKIYVLVLFGCCKNAQPLVISDQNAPDLEVVIRRDGLWAEGFETGCSATMSGGTGAVHAQVRRQTQFSGDRPLKLTTYRDSEIDEKTIQLLKVILVRLYFTADLHNMNFWLALHRKIF